MSDLESFRFTRRQLHIPLNECIHYKGKLWHMWGIRIYLSIKHNLVIITQRRGPGALQWKTIRFDELNKRNITRITEHVLSV